MTLSDIRYALRMLAKNPGFTCVVVLTLALGIGANAAIFSMTDKILVQSLPVQKPEELVVLSVYNPADGPDYHSSFSYPLYQDLRDKNDVLAGVIARGGAQMNVSYGDTNERVNGELISGNYFQVLGVKPWVGRLFTQEDDVTPGGHPVAVLSYAFWSRRFAKDPAIVGKTILINEHPMTVVGVTPPGFYGLTLSSDPDVRVPLMMTLVFNPLPATRLKSRTHQWLNVLARVKSNVPMAQAQASMDVLFHQIREADAKNLSPDTPAFDRERFLAKRLALQPGAQGLQSVQEEMRTSLLLLLGATFVILLILCANLTNLMMARATVRAQEISVRLALGAGRWRLLRQWLTEGLVLSLAGGLVGVFVALWVKAGLFAFIPGDFRRNLDTPFSLRFYGFIVFVSFVVGIVFSLAPAIQAARHTFNPGLRLESRTVAAAGKLFSLRSGLILAQVALSLPLLVMAALLVRSLQNLRSFDPGFNKENVLLAAVNPSLNGYTPEQSHNFYDTLLTRVRALPGVTAASFGSDTPISGGWDQNGIQVEGYTPRQGEDMGCDVTYISTGYLKTLGIPLVAGRDFNEGDKPGSPKVALINEKMAHYFFGNASPLGKRISLDSDFDTTIVGVVKDVTYSNLRREMHRHFYTSTSQIPHLYDLSLHVKTSVPAAGIADSVRNEVKAIDPHLPIYNVKTLESEIDLSLIQERLVTWLSAAFGVLATLLTALGLYGVLTFSVARRTREIGIRVALGAQRGDVFKLVMVRGMILVVLGVVVGIGGSLAFARVLETLMFGVKATNAPTIALVSLSLLIVALIACYIPARRATKVDP
ncbi:MAG TPA: ABC transporter permease, partial [Pyrinomonadaceae bacterium]